MKHGDKIHQDLMEDQGSKFIRKKKRENIQIDHNEKD